LAVAGAVDHLSTSAVNSSKVIIHTDSSNTIDIFNTLRCLPEFNPLLQHCVDVFLHNKFDVHVLHVPGAQNVVADAISHHEFSKAARLVPGLHITPFQPPHFDMMGAAKK